MCKYCGATQIEEVNGRVICSYCKSPQLDIKPISKPKQIISDDLFYTNLFNGCVTLPYIPLIPKPLILEI